MKKEQKITIILGFLTLLVLGVQTWILFNQGNIIDKQTEILDRTAQSNKADLVLVSSQGDRAYELNDLDEARESEPLAIGVINYGKSVAPFAKIKIIPEVFRGVGENQKGWEITEIKSLGDNSTFFRISLYYLHGELNPGEYNVTFSIDCPYCETPYKEENITICVWRGYQEALEDCGERWVQN